MNLNSAFSAAVTAAVQGARINAKESELATVVFLIDKAGKITLAEWRSDEKIYENVEWVRERAKENRAVGLVYVAETTVNAESGRTFDGVLIYGYLRGQTVRSEARTFLIDSNRNMQPISMSIPDKLTRWVKAALSY